MRNLYTAVFLFAFILWPMWGMAQIQVQHTAPTLIERTDTEPLEFAVPGLSSGSVQEAVLYYRSDGEVSFQQMEASYRQGAFYVVPRMENQATSIDYFFIVRTSDGRELTYPPQNPSNDPVQVEVVEQRTSDRSASNSNGPTDEISYNILSPDQNARTTAEDVVIAATFFYEDTTIQKGEFQVIVDGKDVTERAQVDPYFLSYVPKQIDQGQHSVAIFYRRGEKRYKVTDWQFTVSDEASPTPLVVQRREEKFTSGRIQFSARNQQYAQSQDDILRGRVEIRGQQGNIRYNARGNLTTQSSARLQPQNRFSAEVLIDDWAELRGGDFYEQMSRLTLGGQRVRGVNAELHLFDEGVNAMFLYGRMRRSISNRYRPIQSSYDTVGVYGNRPLVDSTYTLGYREQGRGTYRRKIMGGRLSFGDETPIQFGINAVKVQDDTTSLDPVRNFLDAQSRSNLVGNQLSSDEIQYLQQNPEALSVAGSPEPMDNFVASTDLTLNLDRNRIQLDAEAGASLLNEDINGGYLTRERADDLGIDLNQSTEDLLSRLSWLIIVNENMNTLPFRFEENANGGREMEPFVPRGIFGGRSRASFNYLDHRLQVRYRWMGPNYRSLANTTIRRDISGFNVSDRFRLLEDQVYVTLGYENLQNNVLNTREATTKTNTYRSNVSWYPVSRDLPRVSVGARLRDRGNGVERMNPLISDDKLYTAVRNVHIVDGDTSVAPRPVESFTTQLNASISQQFEIAEVINDATFNISYLHTDDAVFEFGGLHSMSYSLRIQNRYSNLPLDTHIGFHLNQSESRGGLASFDIFGFSLGGTTFLMDDQLELSGRLAFTKNNQTSVPLEVDVNDPDNIYDNYYRRNPAGATNQESNTFVVNMNAEYQLADRHALVARANFTNVVAMDGRYLPNDRVLELRYIFDF